MSAHLAQLISKHWAHMHRSEYGEWSRWNHNIHIQHKLCGIALSQWRIVPCDQMFWLLKQHLGSCRYHNSEEVEMATCEWLWVHKPDFACYKFFNLLLRWNKHISVLGRMSKNNDTLMQYMSYTLHSDIMICHLIFMTYRNSLIGQTSPVPLSAQTDTKDPLVVTVPRYSF